jgi:DNA polymerase
MIAHVGASHSVHWDIESRSELRLDKVGAHKYASHPSTEILCVTYAADDLKVKLWLPGDPVPAEFLEIAQNQNWQLCSHNAQFEIALLRRILRPVMAGRGSRWRAFVARWRWVWSWHCPAN